MLAACFSLSPEWPSLLPHHPTMPHSPMSSTLPCLQERTGRLCLNRMHLVCLPAQSQGQLATWLLCQTGLTYGSHVTSITRGQQWCSVQEKGHILSVFTISVFEQSSFINKNERRSRTIMLCTISKLSKLFHKLLRIFFPLFFLLSLSQIPKYKTKIVNLHNLHIYKDIY